MKRLVLLLALIGATFGVMGAATPAASAAANCTPAQYGPIWYSAGYWYFQAGLNCTGHSGARMYGAEAGNGYTGIADVTRLQYHYTANTGATWYVGTSQYLWNFGTSVWGQGCGFPTFTVRPFFTWVVRNAIGNTWGTPVRTYLTQQQGC